MKLCTSMIYETVTGAHKTPSWTQKVLSRTRNHIVTTFDMLSKVQKDYAPILVKHNGKFPNMIALRLKFDAEFGILLEADMLVNGSVATVKEVIDLNCVGVLEHRVSRLKVFKSGFGAFGARENLLGEYCLTFESGTKRASNFQFYIDPRKSERLMASYYESHDVFNTLLDDSDDDDDDPDEIGSPSSKKPDDKNFNFMQVR